ncbi:hypothetical protein BH23PLA1_BH23PLA1_25120 [soil metagenome]
MPVSYRGIRVDCGYRIDLLVNELVILELKSVERIEKIHEAQLHTYLRLTGLNLGLILNFLCLSRSFSLRPPRPLR